MSHLSEEQMVLHYYGEGVDAADASVDDHLAECEACRADYRGLQRVLNTVDSAAVPERPLDYGEAVWRRIAARVPGRRQWAWLGWREWALAGAMAALLIAAFVAGRLTHHPPTAQVAGNPGQVRERILLVAVGDHLERSHTILVELENSNSPDIAYEREAAADLVESNRIYRQTAARAGDVATASLLEDLERVLLEVANSRSEMSRRELRKLQKQIEKRGILFKVKEFASEVQEREKKDQL